MSIFAKGQTLGCGTVCTPQMAAHLEIPTAVVPFSQRALIEIPIKIHIVCSGNDASTGYSNAAITSALTQLNVLYNDVPMHFYECGSRNFIYNSPYYDFVSTTASEALLTADHDVQNAINIYFVNYITDLIGGSIPLAYTHLPTVGNTDRVFISTRDNTISNVGILLGHEMGHYFGLLHTHGIDDNDSPGTTDELVNGSNCTTAGDRICDTPATKIILAQ